MILLDTNVISELRRPNYSKAVFDWVAAQSRASLITAAIVRAEILYGLSVMPDGARRQSQIAMARNVFDEFAVILPFTAEAAIVYAEIASQRRAAGRPLPGFDGLIAATARIAGAAIATGDVADFDGCGVELINPWEAA